MAEVRIRISPQDICDYMTKNLPKNSLNMSELLIEIHDTSDNKETPLLTLDSDDHIDLVLKSGAS